MNVIFSLEFFLHFLVEAKTLKTFLYGFSVLSGPTLALCIASIWCLVPFHNVLEEPCYWYEFHIGALLLTMPFLTLIIHPLITKYWSNVSIKRSIRFQIFLCFVAFSARLTAISVYYFYRTDLAQPLPMGSYIAATIAYFAIFIAALAR